jgi:hypothetical protein
MRLQERCHGNLTRPTRSVNTQSTSQALLQPLPLLIRQRNLAYLFIIAQTHLKTLQSQHLQAQLHQLHNNTQLEPVMLLNSYQRSMKIQTSALQMT